MTLLIGFFVLSILFSFLCSVLEAVLLSVTPVYVQKAVASGSTVGKRLEAFKKDIDRPLSGILTLNTIAHTVGAIGVGAQAGEVFKGSSPLALGPYELSYESIVATVMTLAILILSEIIPKTIGANNWEALTPFTVRVLRILDIVLRPLIWVSQRITKLLKKDKDRSVLSRADFAAMVTLGEEAGTLQKNESQVIRNLIDLQKIEAKNVMTPKTVCLMADETTTLQEFYQQNDPIPFSRIPIFADSRDNITGIILRGDLLKNLFLGNGDKPLSSIRRDVESIPGSTSLSELSNKFINNQQHLAIASDEFGAVIGIVTMEDVIETLLGVEIVDESDKVVDMRDLAKKVWEARKNAKQAESGTQE